MEGGVTSVTGEIVTVPLLTPYAGGKARLGIADSFSGQSREGMASRSGDACIVFGQVTIIDVQGRRLSDCAGGWDDGDAYANGALMTVGGLDDNFANPAQTGSDDEKYTISSYLSVGDESVDATFTNPTGDDSVFAMALLIAIAT
jgi:hypothetical protein